MTYTSTCFEEFFMLRRKITPLLVKRQIAQADIGKRDGSAQESQMILNVSYNYLIYISLISRKPTDNGHFKKFGLTRGAFIPIRSLGGDAMKLTMRVLGFLCSSFLFLAGCSELGQLGFPGDYGNWGGSDLVGEVRDGRPVVAETDPVHGDGDVVGEVAAVDAAPHVHKTESDAVPSPDFCEVDGVGPNGLRHDVVIQVLGRPKKSVILWLNLRERWGNPIDEGR